MRSRDKWTAIEELVDRLLEEHEVRIVDRPDVLEAVVSREKSLSTGLKEYVALPHGRTDAVDEIVGVLGIAPQGIPFESMDGKDAKVLCLMLIPHEQYREYVKTLAAISRLLSDPGFQRSVLGAARGDSAEGVIHAIEAIEGPEFFKL